MNFPLRVLHLEDDVRDTELLQAMLEAERVPCELTRVETEHDFAAALKREKFDLILADYTLPSFDGVSALKLAQRHAPEVPFLFVSGTLGEDVAIEALKKGATDYILKTRLARLGPAITRAMREARERADRKHAQEAARRSEKQLRDVFETIPAMAWSALPDGSVDFMNRAWQDYTGLSMDKALGRKSADIIHPDDQATTIAEWESALKNGRSLETEVRLRRADGEYRWWFVRNVPLRDEHGKIIKWYGTAIDIEGRKLAEEAVRRSEKELRDLIQTIPAMAFVCRPDGFNEFVSRPWIQYSGLSAEQSAGAGWEMTLHPDDVERHLAKWRAAQASGQPFENEARHRDAQGNYRWLLVRAVPLRNEHGNIVKWYGAAIDVEDRKRAEEQVRRSEAYLAEAQRLTHTGSRAHKPGMSKPLYWSEEMFRILGFDPEHGLPDNETVWQRVHPEDLNGFMREQIDKLSSGDLRTGIANDYRIVLPNGTVKYIHGRSHPVFDEAGNVIEYVGTSVDVTDRKRAEALQAGEKRLLEMIATGVPLKEIMNALCLIIEEQRPGTVASVLLMNPDGVHLNVVAGPNLPKAWTRQMEKLPIGPCAGSCGTAAYRGSPVIVSDVATDPLWEVPEHRASALKHALRASWSNPVLSSKGQVLGTFCIYHREPRTPSAQDLELIELATHLVRVAIERDRTEEALRTSEQLARSHVDIMMRSLDVLATEAAPEKFIGEMLRTIEQHLRAMRVLLWLRDQQDDSVSLHIIIEKGQQVPSHQDHPFVKDPHAWKRLPAFFHEMQFTKSPLVFDDIEHDSRISPELREYMTTRGCKKFMAVPMLVSGDLRGFIGIQHAEKGTYRVEEIELAQALTHHVMLAAHGQELMEQQRQAAILKERTRMARDIHDTLAQGFTGVIVQLDTAVEALRDEEPEASARHIRQARELARESLIEARRSVHALRPQALEKAAFTDALRAIITNTAAGTSLRADFQLEGEPRALEPAVEENLLHIGQEALTNALKHACASVFQARLSFEPDAVRLELRDNGKGFVVDSVNGGGIGLIGMKERVQQIGGTLAVTSKPGKGTQVIAVSPYPQAVNR
jgi:PAS domain S-box-containing protein